MNFKNLLFFMLFISNVVPLSIKPSYKKCKFVSNSVKIECSNWDGKCIDTLIFKGGGSRAIVYAGAIKKLEEESMLEEIKFLAGSSSGAQTAALICCGCSSEDLEYALRFAPWESILDSGYFNIKGIYNLISKFGFYDSKNLQNYLESLIYTKTGKKEITFKELYDMSNIHLKVGVCSLTDKKFKYIDYQSYPDMPISVGLTASSSIPFVFTTTKWGDELFIDGGLIGNLPITAFPDNNCLAFNLLDMSDKKMLNKNPKNIFAFGKVVFKILYLYAQEMIRLKNKNLDNIEFIEIYTNKVNLLDVNIKNETIVSLINYGYDAVKTFLK